MACSGCEHLLPHPTTVETEDLIYGASTDQPERCRRHGNNNLGKDKEYRNAIES